VVNRRLSPSSPLYETALQAIEKIKASESAATVAGTSSLDEEDDSLNEYLLDDISYANNIYLPGKKNIHCDSINKEIAGIVYVPFVSLSTHEHVASLCVLTSS